MRRLSAAAGGGRARSSASQAADVGLLRVQADEVAQTESQRSARKASNVEKSKADIRKAFAVFDVDGSGSLDREEFKAVLVASAKDTTPLSDADVLKVFEAVDTDNSGAYQLSLSGC